MTTPRYPNIRVKLSGKDGNAFNLMGIVNRALDKAGIDSTERTQFMDEAMSGDYEDLLVTCMRWVTVT